MSPELKEKWVAALRSGKYTQITGSLEEPLNSKVSNCCLGVLCRVTENDPYGEFLDYERDEFTCVSYGEVLTPAFREHIVLNIEYVTTLVSMNDGMGEYTDNPQTFSQIADWIEINL